MERSWLKKSKWHGDTSYAVKNLSLGLLSIGKGHLGPGKWATDLTEWEVSKRGFLANPKTDSWLCVTMTEYYAILAEEAQKMGEVMGEAFVREIEAVAEEKVEEPAPEQQPEQQPESEPEPQPEPAPEPEPVPEEAPKPKRRRRRKKKAEDE
jgi:hypothetical protein